MSTLSSFIGGGGGSTDTYTAVTIDSPYEDIVDGKSYKVNEDGKVASDVTIKVGPYRGLDSDEYSNAERQTELNAISGVSLSGQVYTTERKPRGEYACEFLPDNKSVFQIYYESGYGDLIAAVVQYDDDGVAVIKNAKEYDQLSSSLKLRSYNLFNLPEDDDYYYVCAFIHMNDGFYGYDGSNYGYIHIFSIAKTNFAITHIDSLMDGSANASAWGTTGITSTDENESFFGAVSASVMHTARNGTVYLAVKGKGYDERYFYYGDLETGAGRKGAPDTKKNSFNHAVTNLTTTGFYSSAVQIYQLIKIDDANGIYMTYGILSDGSIEAQKLVQDANGDLTCTDLTISGGPTNSTEKRNGRLTQLSSDNKKFAWLYPTDNSGTAECDSYLVTLDTTANTLTFGTRQETEFTPATALDPGPRTPLHQRDYLITDKHALYINSTTGKVSRLTPHDAETDVNHTGIIVRGQDPSQDYFSIERSGTPDGTSGKGVLVNFNYIEPELNKTVESILIAREDATAPATGVAFDLRSGDTASETLDADYYVTLEGMSYALDTGDIAAPVATAIKSIQFLSDTASVSARTVEIAEVDTSKSIIIEGRSSSYQTFGYDYKFNSSTEVAFTAGTTTSRTFYFAVVEYL